MRKGRYKVLDQAFLTALNLDMDETHTRLDRLENRRRRVLKNVRIETSITEIRHDLGRVPLAVIPVPRDLVTVGQPRDATATSVFLQATASTLADVYLEG